MRWSASLYVISCVNICIEHLKLSTSFVFLLIEISCSVSFAASSERTCSVLVGLYYCSVVSSLRIVEVTTSIVCPAVCMAVCCSDSIPDLLFGCVFFPKGVS